MRYHYILREIFGNHPRQRQFTDQELRYLDSYYEGIIETSEPLEADTFSQIIQERYPEIRPYTSEVSRID